MTIRKSTSSEKGRQGPLTEGPLKVIPADDPKQRSPEQERQVKRIRRLHRLRSGRELRITSGFQSHEAPFAIAMKLATDFEPYGKRSRETARIQGDCSCNCRWFHNLAGALGTDWGVCANPESPRVGLLTFEHFGCPQYEWDERSDYLDTTAGKRAKLRFQQAEKEMQAWRENSHWVKLRGKPIWVLRARPVAEGKASIASTSSTTDEKGKAR